MPVSKIVGVSTRIALESEEEINPVTISPVKLAPVTAPVTANEVNVPTPVIFVCAAV